MKTACSVVVMGCLMACGGSSETEASRGSCETTGQVHACIDLVGSNWLASQASCPTQAVYSSSRCPTANRVASCSRNVGEPSQATWRYYSDGQMPYTAMQVMGICMGATYTPN